MAKTRRSIMERRNARRKYTATMNRSQMLTKVGAGVVLFASAAVLSQVATPTISVVAQTTKSQFLQLVAPYARDIAGQNDLYASVMIAQAALESGWGNSGLASAPNYNLFGIKGSYNGNTVKFDTLEDDGTGSYYTINDGFRKYSNYGESLQDYADLLTGNDDPSSWRYNFYKGARVSETNSYQDATAYLTGRYATDTSYGTKLNAIIEQNNLTQYDTRRPSSNTTVTTPTQPSTSVTPTQPSTPSTPTPTTPTVSAGGAYTVQAGDSYWKIASQYGISIQELQRLNGTNDYFLYPGQALKVPGTASSNATTSSSSTNTTAKPATPSTQTSNTPSTSAGGAYTVQAGDSYWRIATKYGISIQELQRLNGTNDYFLYPGQSIKVPGSSANATASTAPNTSGTPTQPSTPAPTTPTVSAGGSYTVQAGDSYWRIANKYGISIQELQRLNGTSDYFLYPGQSIKVSGSSANATASTAPSTSVAPTEPSVPSSTTPTVSASGSYTVQAGDSYWKVANQHGMSIQALQQLNGTSDYFLYPGQVIKVSGVASAPVAQTVSTETVTPATTAETPVTPAVDTPSAPVVASGSTYVAKAGDTLYSIAQRNGLDVYKLIELNGGTAIYVGQTIQLN